MANNAISAINSYSPNSIDKLLNNINSNDSANSTEENGEVSFADYLKGALDNVNTLQKDSDIATQQLASGQIQDVHSVLVAVEKADLSLQYTLAIRNKIMDAYSEIMRMQV